MKKKIKIKNGKINWICLREKCLKSCCGSFKDRDRIFNKLYGSCFNIGHEEIFLTPGDRKQIEKIKGKKFIKVLKGNSYIKFKKNSPCPFLKKGLCLIYTIRPQICRAYPFYLDLASGLDVDILCPGFGKGWTDIRKIREYIKAIDKVYRSQLKLIKREFLK